MDRTTDEYTTIIQKTPVLAGRFEMISQLGEGAAGSVFRVRDRKYDRKEVALKILANHVAFDEHTKARFLEELRVLQSITHPNLVAAYDFIYLEDGVAFTLEFVDGQDLGKIFKSQSLLPAQIDHIILQVLRGLSALHARNILHRDLKLENVLLTRDGLVKITDLGLSKRLDQNSNLTKTGLLLGTAQYMAPEYVQYGSFSTASDLYAVGLMYFELLSGKRYMNHMGGEQVVEHLMKNRFKIPELVNKRGKPLPEEHQLVLEKALQPKPAKRYQTAEEMQSAIANKEIDLQKSGKKRNASNSPTINVFKTDSSPYKQKVRREQLIAAATGIALTIAIFSALISRFG